MPPNQRKNRNARKKWKIKILVGFLVVLLISFGVFLYIHNQNKPLYISPLPQNKSVTADTHDVAQDAIKKSLNNLHKDIDSIKKSEVSYVILLKDKSEIILSTRKDIKSQLSSLQFILTRLTMEGKLFSQLDLRYDKPVIRLK